MSASREDVEAAIAAFNANPNRPHDTVNGIYGYHHARRPILATDCDYEIVSFSGVQGRNVEPGVTPVDGVTRGPIERCKSGIEQYLGDGPFSRGDFNINDVKWLIEIAEADIDRRARNARIWCDHQVLDGERCLVCRPISRWSVAS